MDLFIIPGASSLAPHIVMHELKLPHQLITYNPKDGKTSDGQIYKNIAPLGFVPALKLDDGRILTEVSAILQYLADTHPASELAPKSGSFDRAFMQQWLSFISTELHKPFLLYYTHSSDEALKKALTDDIYLRLQIVEDQLNKTSFIAGDNYTVADPYLYVMIAGAKKVSFSLAKYPALQKYFDRLQNRQAIKNALADEKSISE